MEIEAWEGRYKILVQSNGWLDELYFLTILAKNDPCNACEWCYRRGVVEKLGSNFASLELKLTEEILSRDARNNYVWLHRRWVLQTFGGWNDELALCNKVIKDDSYNYFAWNQRFLTTSFAYAIKAIVDKPENAYPWWYLGNIYEGSGSDGRLDYLFLHVISSDRRGGRDMPEKDKTTTKLLGRKHIYAMEILLDLVRLGYEPCLELRREVGKAYPGSAICCIYYEIAFVILGCLEPVRVRDWRSLLNAVSERYTSRRNG